MKITKLDLLNFRNYDSLSVDFNNCLNVICGLNGSGKTNLVEAIYMLALSKSFRVSNDKYLIKKNTDITKVKGEIERKGTISNYQIELSLDSKRVSVDDNKIDKISDYISRITVVVFFPRDMELINAAPSERRRVLNIEISQLYKEYLLLLNEYNKILKQRNAYLKQLYAYANATKDYLDILTKKLIEYGKQIYDYRKSYIDNINRFVGDIYKQIFASGKLEIKYVSGYSKSEKEILEAYRKNYNKEMALGKTLIGIHHDDMEFKLDGNRLKEWGSQGQVKNAILAFKLAEINLIYDVKNEFPILILDDLFSELDKEKVENIIKMLNKDVQTFITTTHLDYINDDMKKWSKMFVIKDGIVEEVYDE